MGVDKLLVEAANLRKDFSDSYWDSGVEKETRLLVEPEGIEIMQEGLLLRMPALESLRRKFQKFQNEGFKKLHSIFGEVATPALFLTLDRKIDVEKLPRSNRGYFYLEKQIDLMIDFFEDLHGRLLERMKTPLQFLQDKKQILYFDIVCQLEPNSTEADVAESLLKMSIGELKMIGDIYEEINDEMDETPRPKKMKQISSAIAELNRKTNDLFGFPIFSTKKNTIALTIPSQVVRSFR